MVSEVSAFFEAWQVERQKIKTQVPALAGAFGTLHQAVMKEGALSVREKELIAMALGLAHRCTPCITLHVQGCIKAGATREQVLEAAGVAVLMQGGPAFTHLPEVLAALEYLEGQARP
ncbi:MAG TPA: carboxymuconolactone decarboxylase family protein [Pirellulales bacterium]|nr:carboxymuconolactone decarboxylase family protein [Pirellulales bacterium]